MRTLYADLLKITVAAAVLSCVIVGGVDAVTSPRAPEVAVTVTVDRTNKGDRLPQASVLRQHPINSFSTETVPALPKRPPVGCDPAFSSISAPSLARIFGHCIT
jgi:hypothetical protein